MPKEYKSVQHTSRNEVGHEELQLETDWSVWEKLWAHITDVSLAPTKKILYRKVTFDWVDYQSGRTPGDKKQAELNNIVYWLKNYGEVAL